MIVTRIVIAGFACLIVSAAGSLRSAKTEAAAAPTVVRVSSDSHHRTGVVDSCGRGSNFRACPIRSPNASTPSSRPRFPKHPNARATRPRARNASLPAARLSPNSRAHCDRRRRTTTNAPCASGSTATVFSASFSSGTTTTAEARIRTRPMPHRIRHRERPGRGTAEPPPPPLAHPMLSVRSEKIRIFERSNVTKHFQTVRNGRLDRAAPAAS